MRSESTTFEEWMLEEWMQAVTAHALALGCVDDVGKMPEDRYWRGYFDAGHTPKEAVTQEWETGFEHTARFDGCCELCQWWLMLNGSPGKANDRLNEDDDDILDGVEFGELPPGVCPSCMGLSPGIAMDGETIMHCPVCSDTGKVTDEQAERYWQPFEECEKARESEE
jgi:hypothetical protein